MLPAISWLTVLSLIIAVVVVTAIAYRVRGSRFVIAPAPVGRQKSEQSHRKAVQHPASGGL